MYYEIDRLRFVKIWLSKDPDIFLPLVNQVRFIHCVEKNPLATFYFVFDSYLLSVGAKKSLIMFCKKYNVSPIDVRADIIAACKAENEIRLIEIYHDEVSNLNDYGCVAAASDILRWLSPVFSLGIYTDFDVEIDTKLVKPGENIIRIPSPFLIPITLKRTDGFFTSRLNVFFCNDVIAVSINVGAEHPFIAALQSHLLARCARDGKLLPYEGIIPSAPYIQQRFNLNRGDKTARETRSAVMSVLKAELPLQKNLSKNDIDYLLIKVFVGSILCVSGNHFLHDFLCAYQSQYDKGLETIFFQSSIYAHSMLKNIVSSQVVTRENDLSFLTNSLEKKEEQYRQAARTIFRFWKDDGYRRKVVADAVKKKIKCTEVQQIKKNGRCALM